MPVAYLTVAVLSGLSMAMMWVYAGGGVWTALLVYILSGNLVLFGMIVRAIRRAMNDRSDATQPCDEQYPAK